MRDMTLRWYSLLIGLLWSKLSLYSSSVTPSGRPSFPASARPRASVSVQPLTFGKKDYVEKMLRLGEDRSFSHEAASRDFGYAPDSFNEGLKREVEEYMKHGK